MSEGITEFLHPDEYERLEQLLLDNLSQYAPELRRLLDNVNGHWGYEDGIYRFYHHSFKVFKLQDYTVRIIAALRAIAPEGRTFCSKFDDVIGPGIGRTFTMEDNQHWVERTAPIVQAFLHAHLLEMAVKYAEAFREPPKNIPSGWAALLCLYQMR